MSVVLYEPLMAFLTSRFHETKNSVTHPNFNQYFDRKYLLCVIGSVIRREPLNLAQSRITYPRQQTSSRGQLELLFV